jgi:hypothetical protein
VIERGLTDAEHRGDARHGAPTRTHVTTVVDATGPPQGANGPRRAHTGTTPSRNGAEYLVARLASGIYSR